MTGKLLIALMATALATPAFATPCGTASFSALKAAPIILAKDKAEREAAVEGKAVVCRPAIKPMTEGRVTRSITARSLNQY